MNPQSAPFGRPPVAGAPPADTLVGIGGIGTGVGPDAALLTMALGSCVAVVITDAETGVIGMVHVALPGGPGTTRTQGPGYYADTGVDELLRQMEIHGFRPTGRRFAVKVVGGASILDPQNTFAIGKKNILAVKKALWQRGLGPTAEDVGGTISRTVRVDGRTQTTRITSPGLPPWTL